MSYKTEKLRARIIEKYGSQKAFADAVKINPSSLSRILKHGRDWKGSKLLRAAELLDISAEDIDAFFFAPDISKRQPRREARR